MPFIRPAIVFNLKVSKILMAPAYRQVGPGGLFASIFCRMRVAMSAKVEFRQKDFRVDPWRSHLSMKDTFKILSKPT